MNTTLKALATVTLTLAIASAAVPMQSAPQDKAERRVSSGISVTNRNGDVTVTWKGKVVFTGKAAGRVTAKSANENGTEFAAAYDGDKVLWENVPGAGEKLKNQ